jgi:hypothetical protein
MSKSVDQRPKVEGQSQRKKAEGRKEQEERRRRRKKNTRASLDHACGDFIAPGNKN